MTTMTIITADGTYHILRPSHHKAEYHGNGRNAWHGHTEVINGHVIEYRSYRYSYRWHKLHVYFDGQRLRTARDYAKADALING